MWGYLGNSGKWVLAVMLLLVAAWPLSVRAQDRQAQQPLCYAVTEENVPLSVHAAIRFDCENEPRNYQQGSLWVQLGASQLAPLNDGAAVAINMGRFDALAVQFLYADGAKDIKHVSRGDYGEHWRIGGGLFFKPTDRAVPINSVILRFDRATDYQFLRLRIVPDYIADHQSATIAAIIASSTTLLVISSIVGVILSTVVGRSYLLWQAVWGVGMILWSFFWSQANLAFFPSMAGTQSAQIASILSCISMAIASISAVIAPGKGAIPPLLKGAVFGLGGVIAFGGVLLGTILERPLVPIDKAIGYVMLVDLLVIAVALIMAWRRGSHEGRHMLIGWSLPMFVLGLITLGNVDSQLWGGGIKLLMLVAATWQALWMAGAVSRRLAMLRRERDEAQTLAEKAILLAERDPLTGLYNRRGFIGRVKPLLTEAGAAGKSAALLLVDLDRFKNVNDQFGHEVGDAILSSIAGTLRSFERMGWIVSRMGGEEFALLAMDVDGPALRRAAEQVRKAIKQADYGEMLQGGTMTASIGVATARAAKDFPSLYHIADKALYQAKREGRDRVCFPASDKPKRQKPARDNLALT